MWASVHLVIAARPERMRRDSLTVPIAATMPQRHFTSPSLIQSASRFPKNRKRKMIASPPASKSSDDGSGTGVPNARLSINSPGNAAWLAMFTRPIWPVVDRTPKKLPPTTPAVVKLPKATFVGLNTEIRMFPATGPGKTSNPTPVTPVNVRLNVSAKTSGPSTLLALPIPSNAAPSTTMAGPGTALYVTPGNSPPSGKHALAAELLSGPLQSVKPPGATKPASKVSTGSPGTDELKVPLELNVMRAA